MRKLLFFLLLLPLFARAQSTKDTLTLAYLPINGNGDIVYSFIEKLTASKADLYQRARVWAALAFNSAKTVTEFDDGSTNIVIKAISEQFYHYKIFGTSYVASYYMGFSMQLTFKENGYRVIFQQFEAQIPGSAELTADKYRLEALYQSLREWNGNVKNGNEDFNKLLDLTKKVARMQAEIINNIDSFTSYTIKDIRDQMHRSAKGDDF